MVDLVVHPRVILLEKVQERVGRVVGGPKQGVLGVESVLGNQGGGQKSFQEAGGVPAAEAQGVVFVFRVVVVGRGAGGDGQLPPPGLVHRGVREEAVRQYVGGKGRRGGGGGRQDVGLGGVVPDNGVESAGAVRGGGDAEGGLVQGLHPGGCLGLEDGKEEEEEEGEEAHCCVRGWWGKARRRVCLCRGKGREVSGQSDEETRGLGNLECIALFPDGLLVPARSMFALVALCA